MNLKATTIIVAGSIAVAGLTASLVVRNQALAKLREKEHLLDRQNAYLSDVAAEYLRLSNHVARLTSLSPDRTAEAYTAELFKLRTEAESLRKQTNELTRQAAEARQARQLPN